MRPSTRVHRLTLLEVAQAVAVTAVLGGSALGAAVIIGQLLRPAPEPPVQRVYCCCEPALDLGDLGPLVLTDPP